MKDSANASELDLGVIPEESKGCCPEPVGPKTDKKPSYPSITFRDKQVERFVEKFGSPKVGEEWTITCKVRVTGFSDQSYGKSVELSMISIIGDAVEEESDEDEGETEMEEKTPMSKRDMVKRMKGK